MQLSSLSSRASRTAIAVLFCFGLTGAASAAPESNDLMAFLERAEKMTTPNEKVKADIIIKEADGTTKTAALVIDASGDGSMTFTEPSSGWKSVTPLAWKDGTVVEKSGAAQRKLGIDEPLAKSDLRGFDFFAFWKGDYTGSMISDENTLEKTVSLFAGKDRPPYTLFVVSFDKAKLIPRMIKFYKDSFSNLVRIRTDKDFVMVGSRPRPTQILIRDFAAGTIRTYELKWSLVEDGVAPDSAK